MKDESNERYVGMNAVKDLENSMYEILRFAQACC